MLRLLENFSLEEVQSAARDALRLGALSFDAVKHPVLYRLEGQPPRLDLELYPYLPRVRVNTTSARDYMPLLSGRAAWTTGRRCCWNTMQAVQRPGAGHGQRPWDPVLV